MADHENHERLHAAGLIDKDHARTNAAEYDKLASLTSDEIDALISVQAKLGGGKMTQEDTSSF